MSKCVQPIHAEVHHFHHKPVWQTVEWQRVVDASGPLLDCADVPLDFSNVFILGCVIEGDAQVTELVTDWSELTVGQHGSDTEPAAFVHATHSRDGSNDRVVCLVGNCFNSSKADIPRDCNEKSHFVHRHDINAEGDVFVSLKDVSLKWRVV